MDVREELVEIRKSLDYNHSTINEVRSALLRMLDVMEFVSYGKSPQGPGEVSIDDVGKN